jgi:hypothetical protein
MAGGKIILKWILGNYNGVIWSGFIWHRIGIGGRLFVSTVMNLRIP